MTSAGAAVDFAAVDEVLASAVSGGAVARGGAAIATREGPCYQGVFGASDPAGQRPLEGDSVFRLASMTKLITAVAVLQLVDEGLLRLDTEVGEVLPEFRQLQVLEGFTDGRPLLRPPSRQATVRELLAHTAGLSYEVWNPTILEYQRVSGVSGIATGRRDVLTTPLVADPGTVSEYGTGLDWAGVLVERVTGRRLDDVFVERVFAPLRMASTSLERLPGRDYPPVLSAAGPGHFTLTGIDYPQDPEFRTGGGCVYTTAGDFLRLQRMLLQAGTVDGVRVLTSWAVDQVLSDQSGGIPTPPLRSCVPMLSEDVDLGPGWHWGLGLMVNSVGRPGERRAGSGGWWGIFNSTFWIDRGAGVAAVLMMQFVPFFSVGARETARAFELAVYEALE